MEADVVVMRDSTAVYADELLTPDPGWVTRCVGWPFEVLNGSTPVELRKEMLRRRLLWLAAKDLGLPEDSATDALIVQCDAQGRLVLMWHPLVDFGRVATLRLGKRQALLTSSSDNRMGA